MYSSMADSTNHCRSGRDFERNPLISLRRGSRVETRQLEARILCSGFIGLSTARPNAAAHIIEQTGEHTMACSSKAWP